MEIVATTSLPAVDRWPLERHTPVPQWPLGGPKIAYVFTPRFLDAWINLHYKFLDLLWEKLQGGGGVGGLVTAYVGASQPPWRNGCVQT